MNICCNRTQRFCCCYHLTFCLHKYDQTGVTRIMRIKKFASCLLALGAAASMLFHTAVFATEETAEPAASAAIATNSIANWPQGPEITSTAAVIMEDSTQTILYAKNMDTPLNPGATVKIMTTLIALENGNLSDNVTMTATGLSGATDGGVHISAQLDEVFTLEQCLYAIVLASANDMALQVAEHIGGTVEGFVELMNTRAKELGCTNTVFTNPTGLSDPNQYSTAHDMALIMKALIDCEAFRTIAPTLSYSIPATNVSGGTRSLSNNFVMLDAAGTFYYQGCLGGKEGFTQASQSTLVCAAERNGMTLISVVLQGANGQTEPESITTLDYGFNNFKMADLGKDDFDVISGGNVILPVTANENDVTHEDIENGEDIQRTYYFSNVEIGTASVLIEEKVDTTIIEENEKNVQAAAEFTEEKSYIPYGIIGGIGLLLFILCIVGIVKVAKS